MAKNRIKKFFDLEDEKRYLEFSAKISCLKKLSFSNEKANRLFLAFLELIKIAEMEQKTNLLEVGVASISLLEILRREAEDEKIDLKFNNEPFFEGAFKFFKRIKDEKDNHFLGDE